MRYSTSLRAIQLVLLAMSITIAFNQDCFPAWWNMYMVISAGLLSVYFQSEIDHEKFHEEE